MRRAEHASIPSGWVTAFDAELRGFAARGGEFTSEDITALVGQPPSSGAVGARMNAAAQRGLIVRTGDIKANRPNQHRTRISTWRGA